MAKGLIPLMLSPSSTDGLSSRSRSRTSVAPPARAYTRSPVISSDSPAHKRNASDITPIIRRSGPPVRAMKRQSQQTPTSLPVLPYTQAEWKKAIVEIKRFYITGRHRACSARCNEILTNTKNISHAHYEKAASLIRTAEEAITSRSRSSSSASSVPSLHSPSGSVSSDGVPTPTRPRARKSSLQREPRSGEKKERPRKKVSFELPKDKSQWSFDLPEPIVRPDSPTLGFDDDYFAAGVSRQELPELPTPKRWSRMLDLETSQRIEAAVTMSSSPPLLPSISEGEELSPASSPSPSTDSYSSEGGYYFARYDDSSSSSSSSDSDSARSVSPRYCETLSSLKTQVASHLSSLDDLLESDQRLRDRLEREEQRQIQQQQQQRKSESSSSPPPPPPSILSAGLRRMSLLDTNISNIHLHGRQRSCSNMSYGSSSSGGYGGDVDDEARAQDRRERIERLRSNGWRRERFDASRYEGLCEQAMAELAAR
ncbi:hypothetical protein VPNG_03806 [Cytospora leucostoma]|uniref:Uncharacterized protein n=1 Tax=Cytospora leucostoma TaxID=1230097 RepID=A0A423XF94_9PEZI|nr:hypothetical protein VPNG_03806 [Cytospora leucostoma]